MTRRLFCIAVCRRRLALSLAACGSEDDATGSPSSAPFCLLVRYAGFCQTSENMKPRSENPSAPIVGGPVPASQRQDPDRGPARHRRHPTDGECGTTQAPTAPHVVILVCDVTRAEPRMTKRYNAKATRPVSR